MENEQEILLSAEERDTIGEIMNISMGSAATAVSTMLEKQVSITTPILEQDMFKAIDYSELEPAIIVKIRYVQGIEGSNVIMLKRHDMRVILDLLMGNDFTSESDEFEFDDMSMSAACEVMNQMIGASATALSEILNIPINISIPEGQLIENRDEAQALFDGIRMDDQVVSISFKMMIKGVLDTTFRCFMTEELAKRIVDLVNAPEDTSEEPHSAMLSPMEESRPDPQPPASPAAPATPAPASPAAQPAAGSPPPNIAPPVMPPMQQQPPMPQPPQMMAPPQQMYYMPPQPPMQPYCQEPQVPVKTAEFPDFTKQLRMDQIPYGSNLGLLMGVQLDVSVVVGRTKRKIKDIMEFGQGTVVLLDTQTGAPAEIVVNGKLIAYGDVVVVGDNFGVKITEIVGTKELMASLNSQK